MERLDISIVQRGLIDSRNKAATLIKFGKVLVNGEVRTKPSFQVEETDQVELTELPKYVGRGGLKLEAAISKFGLDVTGHWGLDIGSSTGGFTDCFLQNGGVGTYAVDVGTNQLDEKLRQDPRVHLFENMDIRGWVEQVNSGELTLEIRPSFVMMDVSFISSTKILDTGLLRILQDDFQMVLLVKPQFELHRSMIGKKGVVKEHKYRQMAVEKVERHLLDQGYKVEKSEVSPVVGGDGNVEYLMLLSRA